MSHTSLPESSQLGKKSVYSESYDPELLFPIARQINRQSLLISDDALPFHGMDCWTHYEVSWLDPRGKPVVAVAEITYSANTRHIIESKSMKLYFNSLNLTVFPDMKTLEVTINHDLASRLGGGDVSVKIKPLHQHQDEVLYAKMPGILIDRLEVTCDQYNIQPQYLTVEDRWVSEVLTSDLLKSNCLVTNQPDWCSVQIQYEGKQINREGLLKYIVSFRNENEFHEQLIEKIFIHVIQYCQPTHLTVYGRSTRRGGIDINSIRSTDPIELDHLFLGRLIRQ